MIETPSATPEVTIYTDGGADPNPGPGGWGAVLLGTQGQRKELRGGEPHSTNNRMELTAAIRSLEALKERCRVRLFTDSLYLRKGITQWLPGWIAQGWRRKTGELQNEDLWRRLAELVREHDIEWSWVKGHAGNRWNERADQLATQAIQEQRAARKGAARPAGTSTEPVLPEVKPDVDVFLRISCARGRGGWAALLREKGDEKVLSGAATGVTPNQLDLLAAAQVLESLPEGIRVALHTGSDYLRNGATAWLEGWKRRGWKTQEGNPVSNRDLWERLERAMTRRQVTWPDVKGQNLPELDALGQTAKEAAGPPRP
ncbi:MAG TPA: ribonuclease HI [Thermoanaerobaculia bacterium]|nr:ribonuclease HI [Thermoanaerobaculia bacterium]